MKKTSLILILTGLIIILAISAVGCMVLKKPVPTMAESPMDETLTSVGHPVLFAMDFEDPAVFGGWQVGGPGIGPNWLANTSDGRYLFEFPSGFLETQDFDYADIQISVDVEFVVDTPVEVDVACRMQPGAGGRYAFIISNEGRWRIVKSGGGETVLVEGGTDAVQPGKNTVVARCVGDKLTLLVNEVELGSATDGDYTSGSLHFGYAALAAAAGTFDNIVVENWGEPEAIALVAESTATLADTPLPTLTATPAATFTPTLVPPLIPTVRPTAIPEDELLLYQTEFEDDDPSLTDWKNVVYSMDRQSFVSDGYRTWTQNGVYHFEQDANTRVLAIYDQHPGTDDVDISTSGGAPFEANGGLGLVCRYSEAGWYQFMVEPHGLWSIRLVKPDENGRFHFHMISSGLKWLSLTTDLRAECKGDRLTFYIEGDKVASLHDDTFPAGKVGFLGWSFSVGGNWNTVNTFSISRAQWNETGLTGPVPTPGADGAFYTTDFARLDDLNPYWEKIDLGVRNITGSPLLIGGPGGEEYHTYLYINDFDPGQDVKIEADIHPALNFTRGLICRYSEDGWYEAFQMKDSQGGWITLVRKQRDEHGIFSDAGATLLGNYFYPAQANMHMTLTCAGDQLSVEVNGETVLYAEDDTFSSGRYGLLFMDNTPGNLRSALLSYTVHPAQAFEPGEVIFQHDLQSPEEITQLIRTYPNVNLQIEDGAIIGTPAGFSIFTSEHWPVNTDTAVEVAFQNPDGFLALGCRSGMESPSFQVRPDGSWAIFASGGMAASGMMDQPLSGKNQIRFTCLGSQLTLSINGEMVGSAEDRFVENEDGRISITNWDGLQLALTSVSVTATESDTRRAAPALLNQVVLPPAYQPGETVFAWDLHNVINGCKSYWGGRDPDPCYWTKNQAKPDWERSFEGDSDVWVQGFDNRMTLFTYDPDLYDLPLEISADVTMTSTGGGAALFCRATQSGRYEFYIQPDGKWYIRRNMISGEYLPQPKHLTVLTQGTVENFDPAGNRMSATCSGPDLIFTLNGEELGRVQDTLYPEGQAGILFDVNSAGSFWDLEITAR